MNKELSFAEIQNLLAGTTTRKKKDTTEPRTMENWWRQDFHFIHRPSYNIEVKCSNPHCLDPRPNDVVIVLAELKDTLMCRYCFLSGYGR